MRLNLIQNEEKDSLALAGTVNFGNFFRSPFSTTKMNVIAGSASEQTLYHLYDRTFNALLISPKIVNGHTIDGILRQQMNMKWCNYLSRF